MVGLKATSGQDPKPPDPNSTPAAAPREASADEKRFEAIERRLREVEAELKDLRASAQPFRKLDYPDLETLIKIRPRSDNALIEKVHVTKGQVVKKGDPLLEVRSAEIGLAKNECRTSFVQWDHDHKFLVAREPLARDSRITQSTWVDTQNDEKKSRLNYLVSREKLSTFGMSNQEIDDLLTGMGNAADITRITVSSPVDGVVVSRDVAPGNFYAPGDVLLMITPTKPSPLRP